MATELDLEQLKQVFASLGEKLANTKGDQAVVAKLAAVEKAIAGLNKQQADLGKKSRDEAKKDRDDLVASFVKALEESEINKNLEDVAKAQSQAGAGQSSLDPNIIKEFKNFKGMGAKVGASMLSVAKFTSTVTSGASLFAANSGKLNGTISGLLSAFGLTGKTAGAVAAAMDENIDSFRGLLNSAEGTIKSIVEMRDVASAAGLTIGEFSDALAKGTQGAKLFGGQNWGALYKGIKDQTRNLAFYGYTSQQLVSAQNDYLDSVANNGDIFSTGQEDLVKGFDKLLRVNDKMATILGKNRDDMLKDSARQAQDSNYAVKMSTYDNIDKNIANSIQAGLEQMGLGEAYKSLFINDGSFGKNDKDLAVLVSYFPDLYKQLSELQAQVKDGTISEDEAVKKMQAIATTVNSADKATRDQLARQGASDIGNGTGATKAIQAAGKVQLADSNPDKNNVGTDINDEFTQFALKLGIQMKEAAAGVQQFVTEMIRPWIDYFKDVWTPLSEGIDWVINGFRELISNMSSFSGSVMALGGLMASGVIVTKIASIIAPVLGSTLFSGLGSLLKLAFRPIALLASGAGSLLKLLTNNVFTRAIAGAVVNGLGGLGSIIANAMTSALKGLPGILAKAPAIAGVAAAGAVAYGVDAVAGAAGLGQNNIDQKQDDKNWEKMNWWQTLESGVARGIEHVGDVIAPNLTNEARAARIANETEYFEGKKEPEKETIPEVKPEEKPEVETPLPEVKPEEKPKVEEAPATEIAETIKALPAVTPQEQTDQNKSLLDQASQLALQGQMTPEQIIALVNQTNLKNQAATEIKPMEGQLGAIGFDADAIVAAIGKADLTNQSQLNSMSQLLQRILDQLKQNLDFSQQTSAVERQVLSDISKYQEDMVRLTRR